MRVQNYGFKLFIIGVVFLGAFVIGVYFFKTAGGSLPTDAAQYHVKALVSDPQALLKHGDVDVDGVKVGQVSAVNPDGQLSRVSLSLNKSKVAPIYKDATIQVRQKTLVGENYIDLTRGHPAAGEIPDGGQLALSRDKQTTPIDKILNQLDPKLRKDVSTDLQALGGGFNGRAEDMNRLLAALTPTVTDGARVTGVLNQQRQQVAGVIQNAGTVFQALADRRSQLASLVRSAKTTADAANDRDQELGQTFQELPSTLQQAQQTVDKLSRFSGKATPVVANLRTSLVDLKPVVHDLKPTLTQTKELTDRLTPLTKVANPTLDNLKTFTKAAAPAFPSVNAVLRQANPIFDYMKPYYKDTVGLAMGLAGPSVFDRYGALGQCTCPVNDFSFDDWAPSTRKAAESLLEAGGLNRVLHLVANQYRKPGQAPQVYSDIGMKYPHVTEAP